MYEWKWEVRASSLKKAVKYQSADILSIDKNKPLIVIKGSKGDVHTANLEECDCTDFRMVQGGVHACKHMIRLAIELGIINKNGNTPEQQDAADKHEYRNVIAMAYGRYHLFHEPVMTDAEYDTLKKEYKEKYGDL